jgi:hypothetical protein
MIISKQYPENNILYLYKTKKMSESNEQLTPIDPLSIGQLVTLPEAAEMSSFSHSFLRKLANIGKLKAKKSGSTWLTTLAAIEEYKNTRSLKNIPKKYRTRT